MMVARRFGPTKPLGVTWKGTGGWVIASQARQEKRSRTVWITFQLRGTTSRVSVTSSPNFDSFIEPQHGQEVGAAITTRSRGRCSGKGLRPGRGRDAGRRVALWRDAACAASSSSVAVVSSSSSSNSIWSSSRAVLSERRP
jgi:hypothetical protein